MNIKIASLALVASAAIALTGCVATQHEPTAAPTVLTPNEVFWAAFEASGGSPVSDPGVRAGLETFGHAVCDTLDSGVSWSTIRTVVVERSTDSTLGANVRVAKAAVRAYCPQYEGELE